MPTLNSNWQLLSTATEQITSNTTGYMRLYLKAAEETVNGNVGHRVYFEFRVYTANPYGSYETSKWGTFGWSISYAGTGASGTYGGYSHYSNSSEVTVVSSSFFVSHQAAYTGNLTSSIPLYNNTVACNVDSLTLPARAYTVSYNANGGTGAPAAQTATAGTSLTLSSTTPSRGEDTSAGFTVTFDGNGGTPVYPTYTATDINDYTFDHWNTKTDNTGTNYNPGDTYTANTSTTLYAIWQKTTTRGGIRLPMASKNGYVLLGWTRTLGSGVYVEDNYVALGDETLHAEWAEATKLVNAKVNGGWSGNVVKVKISGSWVPVINIKTSW